MSELIDGSISSAAVIAENQIIGERSVRKILPLACPSPVAIRVVADRHAPGHLTISKLTAALPHDWRSQGGAFRPGDVQAAQSDMHRHAGACAPLCLLQLWPSNRSAVIRTRTGLPPISPEHGNEARETWRKTWAERTNVWPFSTAGEARGSADPRRCRGRRRISGSAGMIGFRRV